VDQLVESLDLSGLLASYAGRGREAYPPQLMLKIVLFAHQEGRNRPKDWYRDARYNRISQWLGMGIRPSRSAWYEFGRRIGPWTEGWNQQILAMARTAGLTRAERGALDGSTIAANATRRRLVGPEKIASRLEGLREAVKGDQAGQAVAPPGRWMARSPRGRRQQLRRYEELQRKMEQRQEENRRRPPSERIPPEKLRLSPGDPEAPLGLDKSKVYRPLYNVEFLDDLDSPMILAYEVFAQTSENGTAGPMLKRHEKLTGGKLQVALGDAKFACAGDLAAYDAAKVVFYGQDQEEAASRPAPGGTHRGSLFPKSAFRWLEEQQTYRCPEGQLLKRSGTRRKPCAGGMELIFTIYRGPASTCRTCPRRAECTTNRKTGREIRRHQHQPLVDALHARMGTEEGQEVYRLRKQTVELAFADLFAHRGMRHFSGRGLSSARAQVGLAVLVHNGLVLLRHLRVQLRQSHPAQVPKKTAT
jgi:transposase